jgi:hypothetical protein
MLYIGGKKIHNGETLGDLFNYIPLIHRFPKFIINPKPDVWYVVNI